MAIVILGFGISSITGSIGGTTFRRGSSGTVLSQKARPVDKKSSSQMTHRNFFFYLSSYWKTQVSDENKALWYDFAHTCQFFNSSGKPYFLNGFQMFKKVNNYRNLLGSSITDSPPDHSGFADGFTIDTSEITISESSQEIELSSDSFPGIDDTGPSRFVIIFISYPYSFSSTVVKNRYIFLFSAQAFTLNYTPPDFPIPFPCREGQYISIKVISTDAYNRFTNPVYSQIQIGS